MTDTTERTQAPSFMAGIVSGRIARISCLIALLLPACAIAQGVPTADNWKDVIAADDELIKTLVNSRRDSQVASGDHAREIERQRGQIDDLTKQLAGARAALVAKKCQPQPSPSTSPGSVP